VQVLSYAPTQQSPYGNIRKTGQSGTTSLPELAQIYLQLCTQIMQRYHVTDEDEDEEEVDEVEQYYEEEPQSYTSIHHNNSNYQRPVHHRNHHGNDRTSSRSLPSVNIDATLETIEQLVAIMQDSLQKYDNEDTQAMVKMMYKPLLQLIQQEHANNEYVKAVENELAMYKKKKKKYKKKYLDAKDQYVDSRS
jgi:hypothetical protein